VLRDPETVNSPDISKEPQNDLIGTISRQPELEPAAAPIRRILAQAREDRGCCSWRLLVSFRPGLAELGPATRWPGPGLAVPV